MAEQLSLWDATCFDTAQKCEFPAQREPKESKEVYERRRTTEMAEKLGWPPLHIGPVHRWPGVTIAEGVDAWRTFFMEASEGTIGIVMITIHKQLNPLFLGSIDGKTGLYYRFIEVISQSEERHRAYMLDLAEALDWPRIAYWSAPHQRVIGPGRDVWHKYSAYGCCGTVAEVTGVLERRMRGDPESRKPRHYEEYNDDDE